MGLNFVAWIRAWPLSVFLCVRVCVCVCVCVSFCLTYFSLFLCFSFCFSLCFSLFFSYSLAMAMNSPVASPDWIRSDCRRSFFPPSRSAVTTAIPITIERCASCEIAGQNVRVIGEAGSSSTSSASANPATQIRA